ncbi:hypothetical protein DES53_102548 [Roseimicrobium gellanilyticum]|uniref:Uncharacterized protein n=1 Tax=Roseimicrobium gellanilyticum TaxID=748857 RepID=A0A366HR84_9BACT|nr:hypothetical protein DES53_102548 [Roseimicrobium gellanilyticum]
MELAPDDASIRKEIESVFGSAARPKVFTVADGDPECMDYDRLFHAHIPVTLPIKEFVSGMDPLSELLPDGMKYLFPTLVDFVLRTPCQVHSGWAGVGLLNKLWGDSEFRQQCTAIEKDVITKFLRHLRKTRLDLIGECYSIEDFDKISSLWEAGSCVLSTPAAQSTSSAASSSPSSSPC